MYMACMRKDQRRRLGDVGEHMAAQFLARRGARVLAQNVEVDDGEVDIVVEIEGVRVAVEVRSRWREDPLDAFDDTKLDRVRRSARRLSPPCRRIDLVTIRFDEAGAHIRWMPCV